MNNLNLQDILEKNNIPPHVKKAIEITIEEHERLEKTLYDSNAMKELLLDIITHDLKNPAGVISGMTDMMITEGLDNEMVEVIKNSSDNLLKVIEGATVLSQAVLDKKIIKEEMNLSYVIENVLDEYALPLKNAGMEIEYHPNGGLPVRANPLIAEVFKNYISNAIKYASDGKKIVIETNKENGHIIVGIKDFGGTIIPKNELEQIYDRRFQMKGNGKNGRGLGLAIVKRIVEAHEGKVWAEPNQSKGNTFYLKLPSA